MRTSKTVIKLREEPQLRSPALIAAWPGMGYVATGAAGYLKDALQAKELGDLTSFEFFEPTGVVVERGAVRAPRPPRNKFYFWRNPGHGNDLIIFLGDVQPTTKGYQYANVILDVAIKLGTSRIYTCAATPASIHHREKPKVLAVPNHPNLNQLLSSYNVVLLEEGHIGGMNGLLIGAARARRIEGVCLLGEIPYYAVGIPNPKASKAVLQVLSKMLDIEVDLSDLDFLAKQTEDELEQLARSSEQMAQLVASLEFEEDGLEDEVEGVERSLEEEFKMRRRLERLFRQAERDRSKITELKVELDRSGLFQEYEDRFLNLFRKGNQ